MYHIYHTEGIILASTATGESDRFFQILTPDLGLIPAVARGSRALASKLKYHLVDHAYIGLDLVRGKDVWTITGVMPFPEHSHDTDVRPEMIRLSSFIRRLVHGQEPSHELFHTVFSVKTYLNESPSDEERDIILLSVYVHILALLGYASNLSGLEKIGETSFGVDTIERVRAQQHAITRDVERILSETQL
ncbi:MAG: DNA repair protein RecO [Candidatus Yonathbacteria bacterium]|nr:DNA repair protein RecO [Candidatus Yonathbacteria bacterium]